MCMTNYCEKSFSELAEMKDFFQKQAESDIWKDVYLFEVEAKELPAAPICISSIMDDLKIDKEYTEQVEESMATTNLTLKLPLYKGEYVPVNECAMTSVIARTGVGKGPFFRVVSPEDLTKFINLAYPSFDMESGRVLIREGMVAAFHSSSYRVLPIKDALISAERHLPACEFIGGFYSIELTIADFMLYESELVDLYNKELKKLGGESIEGEAMVRITSSDIATSALRLSPFILKKGGTKMQIGTPLAVTHDGNHSMMDFINNCKETYKLFEDATKRVEELGKVIIHNPQGCFHLLGKALDLPKKYVKAACDNFTISLTEEYTTAFSIYNALWDVISEMKANDISPLKIISAEENIARALTKKFQDYDHPYFWE